MLTRTSSFFEKHPPGEPWPSLDAMLLRHDETTAAQPLAAPDAFGDGYLLQRNALNRRVRELATLCDYTPTTAPVGHHRAFGLGALPAILRQRAIPVVPNTGAVREIASRLGSRISAFHIAQLGIECNRILHEASHGVAHDRLLDARDPLALFEGRDWRTAVLELQLCEAFAGAIEATVCADVMGTNPSNTDLVFLKFNAYFYVEPDEAVDFLGLQHEYGRELTFAGLWLAYLCSNFLSTAAGVDRSTITRLLRRLVPSVDRVEAFVVAMDPLLQNAMKMNKYFSVMVNDFYLQFVGCPVPFRQALDFDYLAHFEQHVTLLSRIRELVFEVFENGREV